MDAQFRKQRVRISQPVGRIVVAAYEEDGQGGKTESDAREEGSEQVYCIDRWDGPVVDVSGDDEGRVIVRGQLVRQDGEQVFLVFDEGSFMESPAQMQIRRMEEFHRGHARTDGRVGQAS